MSTKAKIVDWICVCIRIVINFQAHNYIGALSVMFVCMYVSEGQSTSHSSDNTPGARLGFIGALHSSTVASLGQEVHWPFFWQHAWAEHSGVMWCPVQGVISFHTLKELLFGQWLHPPWQVHFGVWSVPDTWIWHGLNACIYYLVRYIMYMYVHVTYFLYMQELLKLHTL